jgi:AIPR protein
MSEFQKNLELYYNLSEDENRLFYERRSKQYEGTDVPKNRIITTSVQIKAFAAIYLEQPHRVSRYYGSIVKDVGSKIFSSEHEPAPYYTAALMYFKLENLFRSKSSDLKYRLDSKYKTCRFHLLMAFRYLLAGSDVPPLSSKKMDKYCQEIIKVLNDQEKSLSYFKEAASTMDNLAGTDLNNRDTFKTQQVTDNLISALKVKLRKL